MSETAPRKTLSADVQKQIHTMATWRPQTIADHLGLELWQVQDVLDRLKGAKKGGRR